MRASILEHFPTAPGPPADIDAYLEGIEEIYVTDAYHSLSIEGYRVSPELIERVRSGAWNPDANEEDGERRDALAARGYYEAFQLVTDSVGRVLRGEDAGAVAEKDHGQWYAALWGPGVEAGIVAPADLAGYRNEPVYIRRSMHVPPSRESVRELMPVFFELRRPSRPRQ